MLVTIDTDLVWRPLPPDLHTPGVGGWWASSPPYIHTTENSMQPQSAVGVGHSTLSSCKTHPSHIPIRPSSHPVDRLLFLISMVSKLWNSSLWNSSDINRFFLWSKCVNLTVDGNMLFSNLRNFHTDHCTLRSPKSGLTLMQKYSTADIRLGINCYQGLTQGYQGYI